MCTTSNNIVFGYDVPGIFSSYQNDYGKSKTGKPGASRDKLIRPPSSGQMFPPLADKYPMGANKSVNRTDFSTFIKRLQERVYLERVGDLKATRDLHQTDAVGMTEKGGLLPSLIHGRPNTVVTSVVHGARLKEASQAVRNSPFGELISEARHAFQWPSKSRLKTPLFLQKN